MMLEVWFWPTKPKPQTRHPRYYRYVYETGKGVYLCACGTEASNIKVHQTKKHPSARLPYRRISYIQANVLGQLQEGWVENG